MMYIQGNCNTAVGCFRPSRKCFSFKGSLLFLLVVSIAHQASARPSQDEDLPNNFNVDDDFKDVDNLEIHHIRLVDGVVKEDHPIIIYKEDFVNEDYVPPKNETKSEKHKRRYKDIANRRPHRHNLTDVVIEETPEKMLFDIIPETPLIVLDNMDKPKKSYMKLVPLVDDISESNEANEETPSKDELNKRPKKFHRRIRRETSNEHVLQKRNPYFRHIPKSAGEVATQIQYVYVKHSVPGKKHNGLDIPIGKPVPTSAPTLAANDNVPISFENRVAADENDRVIVSGGRTTARPTRRPANSIFRDPSPQNFDFSFMNPQGQATTTTRTPIFTRQPVTRRPQESSIIRDPNPDNFDFSFMNQGQQQSAVSKADTSSPQPTQAGISQCVWAIVNCCSSRNSDIRYTCFEQNGCYGAFWGLNPCADNVRENFVNLVADYYN